MAFIQDEWGNTIDDGRSSPVVDEWGNTTINGQSFVPAGSLLTTPAPASSGSASDQLAQMNREQFDRYVQKYYPLEDKYLGAYKDPALRAEGIAGAKTTAVGAFDAATGSATRRAAGYGLNLADDPGYQRKLAMERQATVIDAGNAARRGFNDRDEQIMTGGMTSIGG